jgi:hypothetical protein
MLLAGPGGDIVNRYVTIARVHTVLLKPMQGRGACQEEGRVDGADRYCVDVLQGPGRSADHWDDVTREAQRLYRSSRRQAQRGGYQIPRRVVPAQASLIVAPPSRIVVFMWSGCLRSRYNNIYTRLAALVYD